jgi:hypothetical protein
MVTELSLVSEKSSPNDNALTSVVSDHAGLEGDLSGARPTSE